MKTIKEAAGITGLSIRTLRYYDEIGLLKPAQLSETGYRLYDQKSLEKLQQIMFFRELEVPLAKIKVLMESSDCDREQLLKIQKVFLEKKRNRLNGLIHLISDVMEGANTMSFEEFSEDDIQKILEHTLSCFTKEELDNKIREFGSLKKYKEHMASGFQNEQVVHDIINIYGSKEKAIDAVLQSSGNQNKSDEQRNRNEEVYQKLMQAKETGNSILEQEAISRLEDFYKDMLKLDNARTFLLELAKEYLQKEKLAEATDRQYGEGSSEFIAHAIQRYYGI